MKYWIVNRTMKKRFLIFLLIFATLFFLIKLNKNDQDELMENDYSKPQSLVYQMQNMQELSSFEKQTIYSNTSPLIFIGGMPRSGTTLLRVLLDAHPYIRCGEETRVIPRILAFRQSWITSPLESRRLKEAGITNSVLNSAVSSFILNIIVNHGKPSPRLCNKDPFTLRSATYLHELFPKSKFIFMIRDGRAVVHSIISRKVTISGFDLTDYKQCFIKWNNAMEAMNNQCSTLGLDICLPVNYEKLVLEPEKTLRNILKFLDVPWNNSVLYHEKLINKPGEISLSKLEKSTDQVIKPINIEALGKWDGKIPRNVLENLDNIAPMFKKLGYNTHLGPQQYGKPDKLVVEKQRELLKNSYIYAEKESHLKKMREEITNKINNIKTNTNEKEANLSANKDEAIFMGYNEYSQNSNRKLNKSIP